MMSLPEHAGLVVRLLPEEIHHELELGAEFAGVARLLLQHGGQRRFYFPVQHGNEPFVPGLHGMLEL